MLILRLIAAAVLLAGFGGGVFWFLTVPRGLPESVIAALPEGDPERGAIWFHAGGCASCHAAPGAAPEARDRLAGGLVLRTDFGNFVVPNISSHPVDGIGGWSVGDFANAMLRGVSPESEHYYPSFPYGSYARMRAEDVADLWGYLKTLPPVEGAAAAHDLSFPFGFRRGIGLWKLAFLSDAPVIAVDPADPVLVRGQYLVEGPGHCAECHTPRNLAGGLQLARWMAGGPNPDGEGRIPNITGGPGGIGDWTASDIAYYLETGFTPDFNSVGGSMAAVQRSVALLAPEDRDAMAAYLKALPALPDG